MYMYLYVSMSVSLSDTLFPFLLWGRGSQPGGFVMAKFCGLRFWGGVKHRKVDVRLPGKGNSNFHGARPVY
jgi:hypothetical protein